METGIYYPTKSSLLAGGVRVPNRVIRRSKPLVQDQLEGVRDAFHSRMWRGLQVVHRLRRQVGDDKAEERKGFYKTSLRETEVRVEQLDQIREALRKVGGEGKAEAPRLVAQIDEYVPLVQQVVREARRRVLAGKKVPAREKVVSIFEPHTRIIPRHKGGGASGIQAHFFLSAWNPARWPWNRLGIPACYCIPTSIGP